MFQLSNGRKEDIERIVDDVLAPYESNLENFDFREIMNEYNIIKIRMHKGFTPGGQLVVVKADQKNGLYGILLDSERYKQKEDIIGHEFAHLKLDHPVLREIARYGKALNELSGFQQWHRMLEAEKKPDPFPNLGDTPEEHAEANYFSQYWNKRLECVDWLRNAEIEDGDKE